MIFVWVYPVTKKTVRKDHLNVNVSENAARP